MIKTTSTSQDEIIKNIMELYSIDAFDLDPTYSKGNFYKNLPKPKLCFDIAPQSNIVAQASADALPLGDASLRSIMFDPPFLATKGPSLKEASGNLILKRFSVFPTESELFSFYFRCLKEFHRVLSSGGFLVFKCQDKVSSAKQYFSHIYVHNMALEVGFYPKDLFVLINEKKMVGKWGGNQKHAWKTHSYFWVFEKRLPKVDINKLLEE